MPPSRLLVAAACALTLAACSPQPPGSRVAAREPVPLRITLTADTTPQSAPQDPCFDYDLLEAGTAETVRQDHFNHLDARGYARWRMACTRGWGGDQYVALDDIWTPESGWYHLADGPGSCWGIPQACEGSKMASHGADWRTNPRVQVRWGLDYIAGRFGSPVDALSFRRAHGWY